MRSCDAACFYDVFVLSGAGLNLAILPSIGVVGVIYVVLRVMGKMAGAWFGATVMKADHNVRRWLGQRSYRRRALPLALPWWRSRSYRNMPRSCAPWCCAAR